MRKQFKDDFLNWSLEGRLGSEVEHLWLGQALGYLTAPRLDGWAAVDPRTTQARSEKMEVCPWYNIFYDRVFCHGKYVKELQLV